MGAQKLTGIVPPAYNKFGATYAEIIDCFSNNGYDIQFSHPFGRRERWTASVYYSLSNNASFEYQIRDDNGDFFYSNDWEEVANKAISFAISLMEEDKELGIKIILP